MIKNIKWLMLAISIIIILYTISASTSKYKSTKEANIILNIRKPTYTVSFYANITGNETEHETQTFTYDTAQNLRENTFIRTDYNFAGWTTNADGTGTSYADEELVNNLSQTDGANINLYAKWVTGVAEYNGTIYQTLQDAVTAVGSNSGTVILLTNTSEQIIVEKKQIITFDLRNNTITNAAIDQAIIENSGTIYISNGTLRSNGNPAAINNNAGANLYVSGGKIIGTNTNKGQAIYNNGGRAEISGSAYLCSSSTNRATVHNLAAGMTIIKGGTIVSNSFVAVRNDKGSNAVIIGEEGNGLSTSSPVIQGGTYGIDSVNNAKFEFYDGIIKGRTAAINNETIVSKKETGYDIAHSVEDAYKTAYLAVTNTVTFDPNGGNIDVNDATRKIEHGTQVGPLPTPTNTGYIFLGWFTLPEDGEEILPTRVVTADVTFYAQWQNNSVAEVDGVLYNTLQSAVNAIPANTEKTITIIKDIQENVEIPAGKIITLDIGSYTITNANNNAIIKNKGQLTIFNGTIVQNGTNAAIDVEGSGKATITGGNISSNGGKGCVFAKDSGKVEISGDAYLISNASGTTDDPLERATIMTSKSACKAIITGGTVIGTAGHGVSGIGTLTIGTKSDGQISSTSPVIQGMQNGVKFGGILNYYDGIIKGVTGAIDGTIADQEPNTQIVDGTETIDNDTYLTKHLEATP